jgi:hypothetical protein
VTNGLAPSFLRVAGREVALSSGTRCRSYQYRYTRMSTWADFINECHKTKITQIAPTALPSAAETLKAPPGGSTSRFINDKRSETLKRSSSLPACRYDPVLHKWRLNGEPTESGTGANLGTVGSPGSTSGGADDTMPLRSSLGRAGKAMATSLTFRPDTSLEASYGKLFGPPPENASPRRLRRPAPLSILMKDAAGKLRGETFRSEDNTRTMDDSTIVAPKPRDPDLTKIAEKYWRTHNLNPVTGKFWDETKERTIASVEERENHDRTTRRIARLPTFWQESLKADPIAAPDEGVTTQLLRTGKRFHIQK